MPVITLRVIDEIKSEMDQKAEELGISTSELMRRAIDALLLGRDDDNGERPSGTTSLSMQQRLIYSLLHEILYWQKATISGHKTSKDPVESDPNFHLSAIEILTHGFSGEYESISGNFDAELREGQCRFLWDTLDMYRILIASFQRLTPNERGKFEPHEVSFAGFDANDQEESGLLGYCRFLFSTDRWVDVSTYSSEYSENFNSHSPMIHRYRIMLGQWRSIQRSRRQPSKGIFFNDLLLTSSEMRQILDAPKILRGQ